MVLRQLSSRRVLFSLLLDFSRSGPERASFLFIPFSRCVLSIYIHATHFTASDALSVLNNPSSPTNYVYDLKLTFPSSLSLI